MPIFHTRRSFVGALWAASADARTGPQFFQVVQRRGRWRLLSPEGRPFFSLGLNHIDSSALRYQENFRIWREKYGNDEQKWIRKFVAPTLRSWGFNTIGWTQEVVVRGSDMVRHSPSFRFEEYQSAGMPYCHMLPFVEFHQWDYETRYPDFFGTAFEDWCDYVARAACARMAHDSKLIGYFYSDCPTWVHTNKPDMKKPLFDPDMLRSEAGRRKLSELATRYYALTKTAIRRYDPNHLILGDRYEARVPLPEEVVRAALPHVDVLSFQYFATPEEVRTYFTQWHTLTRKPVLLADSAVPGRRTNRPPAEQGKQYGEMLATLRDMPFCVGWHYCGAFLKNRTRKYGFLDEQERFDPAFIDPIRRANRETELWARTL